MEEKSVCDHCNINIDEADFVIKDKSFNELVKSIDRNVDTKLSKRNILKWLLENATPKSLNAFDVISIVEVCMDCNEDEMVKMMTQQKVFLKLNYDNEEKYDILNNENLAAEIAITLGNPQIMTWILKLNCNQNPKENILISLLLHAARERKLDHVKILVDFGANLVGTAYQGCNVVQCIAQCGSFDIIKWIVSSGKIEKNHDAYSCAIMSALKYKHYDIVEYLVENTDIDLSKKIKNDPHKMSTNIINVGAKVGNINLILWLMEKGAKLFFGNDKKTIVNIAIENGHVNLLKWLWIQGGDFVSLRSDDQTLLHLAAEKGHIECVKYLVHKKFDVNAKDKDGVSVLHYAVASKNVELVKFVIAHGAIVHVEDHLQANLIHKAHDSLEMLQLLVSLGFDLSSQNSDRAFNVLNLAARHYNYKVVHWLLKQGMNIKDVESQAAEWLQTDIKGDFKMLNLCIEYVNESLDKTFHPALLVCAAIYKEAFKILSDNNASFDVEFNDSTPLIKSLMQCIDSNYTVAQYLLQQGVNVKYKCLEFGDALYISIMKNDLTITHRIVELGGDVNTKTYKGYTALGLAVSMLNMDAIQYLLSQGADINATDHANRTVLQVVSDVCKDYALEIKYIKCLVMLGADPNYYNVKCTPLLCKACKNEDMAFVNWLLNHGADPNLFVDNTGPIIFKCLTYFTNEVKKLEFITLLFNHNVQTNVLNLQDENLLFPCIENIKIVDYLIRQGIDINYVNINSCSALHEALDIKHYVNNSPNQIKVVMKLLHNGADITIADAFGVIPLHLAASNKHCSDVARLLVERGTSVNARDSEGNTVLHYTCQGELAMWLCEKGANINAKNDQGLSVLHSVIKRLPDKKEDSSLNIVSLLINCTIQNANREAILTQYLESIDFSRYMNYVEFLVTKVQNVEERDGNGKTAMHNAVMKDNTCLLNMFVEKGANILNKSEIGNTVLHYAASAGSLSVVACILENLKHELLLEGNDANESPLHLAVMAEHANIVKLLLQHGIKVDQKNDKSMTALHLACKNGNLEMVKLLLFNGANLYETCSNSITPIHMAIQHCKFDVFEYLLEFEAKNPNCEYNVKLLEWKTEVGETLLHVAAKFGRLNNIPTKIIQYLINNQVYPIDSVDKLGNSALHYACCTYVSGAVELLVDNGANVNLKNNTGNTPLHFAAKTGRAEIVEYLLLQGGNVNAKNKKGNSPIHLAAAHCNDLFDRLSLDLLYVRNRKGNSIFHMAPAFNIMLFRITSKNIKNYNIMNQKNQSPLTFAAKFASLSNYREFITNETINAKDVYGNTPLHMFFQTLKPNMRTSSVITFLDVLCSRGANLLDKNKNGYTVMHVAIAMSDPSVVTHLIQYVSDVNVTDDTGHNILHAALYNMGLEVIQPLFIKADLNAKTNNGETYLHIVPNTQYMDVLEWLIPQCTSIINEKDGMRGDTALMKCVKYNLMLSTIQLFVENGADVLAVNDDNQTVLDLSQIMERQDLVEYFTTLN